MFSDQADGASAVAITLGSTNSFVTPGAKLLSIVNGNLAGLERMNVDYRGDICMNKLDNAQSFNIKSLSELAVIPADASGYSIIQIPVGSLVIAVSARVVVTIPTASTISVGVDADASRYASWISSAAGTTAPGLLDSWRYYGVATNILFTPDDTPATDSGRVRITIHYIEVIPPTS